MQLTADQIAALVKGQLKGNGQAVLRGVAGLAEAGPSDISFLKDAKHAPSLKAFEKTSAGAVLVPKDFTANGKTAILVDNPLAAFAAVLNVIAEEKRVKTKAGVHPNAYVAPTAKLGKNVTAGPFCVVEEHAVIEDGATLTSQVYVGARCHVGRDTVLYPQVILREDVHVGARCVIHAGAVIGSDGYGFYYANGQHNKIPQVGTVVIEDDVEIGSCTTIDRATTGRTLIKKGTKIDNLVQIAHNVEVGPHALLVAQVGIAGSSSIGQGAVLAGQVGVADHVTIGAGVQIGAQSGIKDDAPAGAVLFGSPAQPIQDTIRQTLLMRKLPDLFKDVKALKEKMGDHGK